MTQVRPYLHAMTNTDDKLSLAALITALVTVNAIFFSMIAEYTNVLSQVF